jgi:putative PEP-CTERM system histidine kinase
MPPIGVLSYGAGGVAFLVLSLLALRHWQGRLQGGLLLAAAAASALWAGYASLASWSGPAFDHAGVRVVEVVRNLLWYGFLFTILGNLREEEPARRGVRVWSRAGIFGLGAVLIVLILAEAGITQAEPAPPWLEQLVRAGLVIMVVIGLVLIEQLFRNAPPDRRWGVKHMCVGLGGIMAYDFYLYADALLFSQMDEALWQARGIINALVVPLIGLSAARNPQWAMELSVSHRMVFHSAALFGTGLYLVLMAAAGYYIRVSGGTWGAVLQATFLFGALVVLVVLLFSGHMRARLKVFLSKHFFSYKYDYRDEWLRFIATLSDDRSGDDLPIRTIRALAQIVESPGGLLFLRDEAGPFALRAEWNLSAPLEYRALPADAALPQYLKATLWVVDLDEFETEPDLYEGLTLPSWLHRSAYRFIVPLMHEDELMGFIALARTRTHIDFNWEDSDLLKTAGRQAAAHLAQMQAAQALTEARQFETFNRLAAFVIHDLKNLVAQLSLLVTNAGRHKGNPAFIDDMVATVESSVARMNRLLEQLRSGRAGRETTLVSLAEVVREVVTAKSVGQPVPRCSECNDATVTADRDRLAAVIGHLIQNAQDATPNDGQVEVRLRQDADRGIVIVEDTGVGMAREFIREHLFQPFYTTKGSAGMGIGAYEAREFARSLGGDLLVESAPDKGTMARLEIPLAGRVSDPG